MTTNEILATLAAAARQNAGNPQWQPFFKSLHDLALQGQGKPAASGIATWHDDGSRRNLVQKNSLLHFCSNVNSTRGDDGIIRRIFMVLGVERGFFIEFGAWDGIFLSNCRALAQQGWTGCFIEADHQKAQDLRNNYRDRPDIICLEQMVLATPAQGGKTLDEIAGEKFPGRHVDFLSIDIDGLDYRIFEEMTLRPTIVCIEGGFSWHPRFAKRVPDEIAARDLQQPLAVMIEIGKSKSYTPICFNQNTYFVVNELADKFADIRNDPVTLWRDAWFNETQMFREFLASMRNNEVIRAQEGPEFARIDFDGAVHPPLPGE
jgi:hypothetical protein